MRRPDKPAIRVQPLTRSASQIEALRECALAWHTGAERFWSFDDVLKMLERPICAGFFATAADWAGAGEAPWLGFMMVDISGDCADLLYVYVKPDQRGQGVGEALLEHLLADLAADAAVDKLLLEVRPHNAPARALYAKLGFHELGVRKTYYANGDDALVLVYEFARAGRRQ